jgi:hypothetical protein
MRYRKHSRGATTLTAVAQSDFRCWRCVVCRGVEVGIFRFRDGEDDRRTT